MIKIYDSRNYQVFIDYTYGNKNHGIYDSRNYQVFIDLQLKKGKVLRDLR